VYNYEFKVLQGCIEAKRWSKNSLPSNSCLTNKLGFLVMSGAEDFVAAVKLRANLKASFTRWVLRLV
jgi:hypothetical protein